MKTTTLKLPVKNFNRLTAPQKRVAIAQDVLAQIKIGQYSIESGIWAIVDLPSTEEMLEQCKISQDTLLNGKLTIELPSKLECRCCALGGALLSSIRLANVHTFDGDAELKDDVIPQLGKYFSLHQMALIEAAFELRTEEGNMVDGFDDELSDAEFAAIGELRDKFENETERAQFIFKNIVKNKGEFKL